MKGTSSEIFKSEYFVMEMDNFHVKADSPKEIVEQMRNFRKQNYGDEFIYGNPAIHSETKDGIHLDNE